MNHVSNQVNHNFNRSNEEVDCDNCRSIAGSFSTSAYTSYYINNTDKIGVQPGGANLGLDGPKKYKSKAELIKKYAPYKNDVDQILQGLEYNKAQMKQISKKLNKQAEEETNK